jgi:hypothetical protein
MTYRCREQADSRPRRRDYQDSIKANAQDWRRDYQDSTKANPQKVKFIQHRFSVKIRVLAAQAYL